MPSYRVSVATAACMYVFIPQFGWCWVPFLFLLTECFLYTSELSKWLEPVEKLRFEIGSIPSLIDYIKQVLISPSVHIYQ